MFTEGNWGEAIRGIFTLGLDGADLVILAVGCLTMAVVSSLSAKKSVRERLYDRPVLSWTIFGTLLLAVILLGAYGVGYDASQFIYNQF
jgi:hypothetical protein